METWYKAGSYPSIQRVDVIRETEKCVFTPGYGRRKELRNNKCSHYENYFQSYQEAYDFLLAKKERLVENKKTQVKYYKKQLNEFVEKYGHGEPE